MWKRTLIILGLAVVAAALIFACGPSAKTAGGKKKGKVVATVGSSSITTGDIEDILSRMPPFQRRRYAD